MTPTGRTRVFAVLGDPVHHSLSPRMHNAGFRAMGLDATYLALRPSPQDVGAVMTTLARDGGGGNVTIPYKAVAAASGAARSAIVDQLGVANTFVGAESGRIHVDNTDVGGIVAALSRLAVDIGAIGVIGTGGSARAVAGAAHHTGAALAVRSRDASRAAEFSAWAASIGVSTVTWEACDVIVNATPVGLHDAAGVPVTQSDMPPSASAVDLVYRASGKTAWIAACEAAGRRTVDGRVVLLAQGAASWGIWFPGVVAPLEVMQAALDGHLG